MRGRKGLAPASDLPPAEADITWLVLRGELKSTAEQRMWFWNTVRQSLGFESWKKRRLWTVWEPLCVISLMSSCLEKSAAVLVCVFATVEVFRQTWPHEKKTQNPPVIPVSGSLVTTVRESFWWKLPAPETSLLMLFDQSKVPSVTFTASMTGDLVAWFLWWLFFF